MKIHHALLFAVAACAVSPAPLMGDDLPSKKPILQDDFDREESSPEKEEIGGGWSTNSKSRAKGNKQVDLADGAMHITRHPVADHGVSVVHDIDFRDVTIQLRFKLGQGDDLGINIADMKEKSVHAGHICMARIRSDKVEISDLKTGRMKLEHRTARLNDSLTDAQKKLINSRSKQFSIQLSQDQWHELVVQIEGDTMRVLIAGKLIGEFSSPGISHPTKRRLRLAVNKSAWVDDVKIWDSI